MSRTLAIDNVEDFLFGLAPRPVCAGRGVSIGAGQVIPEINFTLPPMTIDDSSWAKVRDQYSEIMDGVLKRAVHLEVPQLLVEFETLPDMTNRPAWGLDIARLISDKLDACHERHGLRSALRFTVNDVREFTRPPLMRRGRYWDSLAEIIDKAASAGADMLAIESTGGKEVSDDAIINCDLPAVVFALGVLGGRDIRFLWEYIVDICRRDGIVPSGDSACGFANTAMVLAEQKLIPRFFAAIVRAASVPRTLEAIEAGAVDPTKDCAYEGPYLKAIAGVPISMEGKSAACAHLSTIGNISQAVCDCWSNESTHNVRLLSTIAPVVSMEELTYDCRLMNTSMAHGKDKAALLRDWLSESDCRLDPQAWVLRPDVVLEISREIVREDTCCRRTVAAARAAVQSLRRAQESGELNLRENERKWVDILQSQCDMLPDTEEQLLEQMLVNPMVAPKFKAEEYGFEAAVIDR
jgi:methanol--5-hydroxybenzimidazolylcobamide Co-methyltransferase